MERTTPGSRSGRGRAARSGREDPFEAGRRQRPMPLTQSGWRSTPRSGPGLADRQRAVPPRRCRTRPAAKCRRCTRLRPVDRARRFRTRRQGRRARTRWSQPSRVKRGSPASSRPTQGADRPERRHGQCRNKQRRRRRGAAPPPPGQRDAAERRRHDQNGGFENRQRGCSHGLEISRGEVHDPNRLRAWGLIRAAAISGRLSGEFTRSDGQDLRSIQGVANL